jgi:hypothetical protein
MLGGLALTTQGKSRVPELGPLGSVRGALSNEWPLYVATCAATEHIWLSGEENGEPLVALGSEPVR